MAAGSALPDKRMPKGFCLKDYNFSKLFKCVHVEGMKVMSNVVHLVYSHPSTRAGGGTMPLKDYLKTVLKWNARKMKLITKIDAAILEKDLMKEDFDISLAYKLLKEIFPDFYSALDDECKNNIEYLKNTRNKVCHKYYMLDVIDVENDICQLKQVYQTIYLGVSKYLQVDLSQLIACMEQCLTETITAQVRQDDMDSYWEDVRAFREANVHCLIVSGRRELQELYKKLRVANPCSWMVEKEHFESSVDSFYLEEIYTPLQLQDNSGNVEAENLFMLVKKRRGVEEHPVALLLFGLTGCGKTSLCRYILYHWLHCHSMATEAIARIQDFDLVLLVEVRAIKSSSLQQYLREQLIPNACRNMKPEDIIPSLQELQVLFIVDGFDEKNDESHKLIEEIFAKFGNSGNHRIVLTARPEYHEDSQWMSKKYHVDYHPLEIYGFNEDSITAFTQKVFRVIEKDAATGERSTKAFLDYISRKKDTLQRHLNLPLTLALLIYLWKDNPQILNRITTSTTLFYELFELCKRRMQERLVTKNMNVSLPVLSDLLMYLGEVAWCLLKAGIISEIPSDKKRELREMCRVNGVDPKEFMSAFLNCQFEENQDEAEHSYSFLHKKQMEYLAAFYLSYRVHSGTSLRDMIAEERDCRKYKEVIKFLTGHLARETILPQNVVDVSYMLSEADITYGDYNYWWDLYLESMNNPKFGKMIADDYMSQEMCELSDEAHVPSGLRLLLYLPVRIEALKIDLKKDPYDIPEMLNLMKKMRSMLTKRGYGKDRPIAVELYFWWHNSYPDCPRSSSDFLLTLNPWGHLTNFTGSIDLKCEKVLGYCFKLKRIRVRVASPEVLRVLGECLKKIHKSVKVLRITLDLHPDQCPIQDLTTLNCVGDLVVILPGMREGDKEWVVEAVKKICGPKGCKTLTLDKSEVHLSAVRFILRKLKNVIHEKLELNSLEDFDARQTLEVQKLQQETHITIELL